MQFVKEIRNILVPLDGSKNSLRGLERAIYLALSCQARITGIVVVGNVPVSGLHNVSAWRKDWIKLAKKELDKAKRIAARDGIDLREKISHGNPGSEIVNYAAKNKVDLIVIGARGMGGIKEAFLGSTSQYIAHKAKAPVVIVK